MTRNRFTVAVLAAGVLLAGCGGDTSVGLGLDTENLGGTNAECRLGECGPSETPTPTPTPTAAPTVVETQAPEPTQAPTQAPPPEPTQQIALEVKVYSDTEGPSQFDPSLARIFAKTCIRWTNVDTVERSVEADDGSFSSGPMAPGAEFIHCFETAGKFNYHDGTRPYAVAAVEVLAQ